MTGLLLGRLLCMYRRWNQAGKTVGKMAGRMAADTWMQNKLQNTNYQDMQSLVRNR